MKLNINKHQQTQTQQKLNLKPKPKPKPSWWRWISPLQTLTKILWSKPKHKHKLNPSFSCRERKETQTQKCILIHWSKPTLQSAPTPTPTELRFCKILTQTQKTWEWVRVNWLRWVRVRVNRLGWIGWDGWGWGWMGEGESVNGWGWMGEVRVNRLGWGVGESVNGWVWSFSDGDGWGWIG